MWWWMGQQNGPADSDRPDHAHLEALARSTGIDVARLSAMVLPWIEEAPRLADRLRVTAAPWRIVKIVSDPDRTRVRAMTGALDWAALGQLAGQYGHHLAAGTSVRDWRAALETCAIAASEQNVMLGDMPVLAAREAAPTQGSAPVVQARTAMVTPKRPQPVSVLDGLKDRVGEALAQARTDLTAQGQPVTAKALRRRADQILRKQGAGQGRGLRVTDQNRCESSG